MFARTIKYVSCAAISAMVLSGCALGMHVPIKDPAVSPTAYSTSGTTPTVGLAFKDDQSEANKKRPLTGTIPMNLDYNNKPFESGPWIAEQTVREMVARGLPVTLTASGNGGPTVHIKRLHIDDYRSNGFSPFVTFTSLSADVDTPHGVEHIAAYVKRGKVPVWSFDEVIDPTFNDSLSILTKELAAKINQLLYQQAISNDQVNGLIAKIEADKSGQSTTYLSVYQLGFGNNPSAIPELVKLSSHPDEYVRLAAVSSLGILKATDQMDFLVGRYESSSRIWQDRAMALKAIGDLNTPEGRAYLQAQQTKIENEKDKDARWTRNIIALYLRKEDELDKLATQAAPAESVATTVAPSPAKTASPTVSEQPYTPPPAAVATSIDRPASAQPLVVQTLSAAPAPQSTVVQATPVAVVTAPATRVVPSPTPAATSYSDTGEADFKLGESSNTVEKMGKQDGCQSSRGAGLVTDAGPIEVYRMVCQGGAAYMAKCEFRQCTRISDQ